MFACAVPHRERRRRRRIILLFIDIALAISPDLKIEVYGWLYDHLIADRNNSGDSYKLMCGALYSNAKNKARFAGVICDIAFKIQAKCGVKNWQHATEEQLKQRDDIHKFIALIASNTRDNEGAIRMGLNGIQ